jgi:dTDP-4-amino-4,6-dideoxygalactose transaminase
LAILKSLNLTPKDEVLLQAFTCVAVPNSISWANFKPTFIDIDETLNLDPQDLKKKITPHSRAVIIQHTFGYPAQIEKIKKICQEHNLFLIEDCAHSLGAKYQGHNIGTFSDAAFFSFGRDKAVSSVFGGLATTNNIAIGKSLKEFQVNLQFPSRKFILQNLLHPVLFELILPAYYFFNLGKFLLILFQRLNFLNLPVEPCEKKGQKPQGIPRKLPNAMAYLAQGQLERLNYFINHRIKIARLYQKKLQNLKNLKTIPSPPGCQTTFLRYPILVNDPESIRKKFHSKFKTLLGNWYRPLIAPAGVDVKLIGYQKGSCPKAEEISQKILNLPTSIRCLPKQAKQITQNLIKLI